MTNSGEGQISILARAQCRVRPAFAVRAPAVWVTVPLPPDVPKYRSPANLATGVARTVNLVWYGGPWAHYYDIYFGTSPTPPLYRSNKNYGPSTSSSVTQSYTIPVVLAPHTTYYWKIVSKTAAFKKASGTVRSFTTGG